MTDGSQEGFPEGWQVPAFTADVFADKGHACALVVPVINEGDRIRDQIARTRDQGSAVDLIIADGGSTDGSLAPAFLREMGVRALLTKTGPGKLSAQLRMAYAWALQEGYDGIVTVDGNGKDGLEGIDLILARLQDGYGYVQGSRYARGGKAVNTPLSRWIAGRLIHAPVVSLAARAWFTDTTNGFRGYSRAYLLDPGTQPFRDVFMVYNLLFYLSVRASRIGYRVCEVGVRRAYPDSGKVPTKIAGLGGKLGILKELFAAAFGRYNPKGRRNP